LGRCDVEVFPIEIVEIGQTDSESVLRMTTLSWGEICDARGYPVGTIAGCGCVARTIAPLEISELA
jgi:hypothetical protein